MKNKTERKKGIISQLCSRCKNKRDHAGKRYCLKCHAEYMREYRKTHGFSEEQKIKQRARTKFNRSIRMGTRKRFPCEACGEVKAEGHHDNYDKPYEVRWLCRKHHLEHHENLKKHSNLTYNKRLSSKGYG